MGSERRREIAVAVRNFGAGVCAMFTSIQFVMAVETAWGRPGAVLLCVGVLIGVLLSVLTVVLREEPSNDA